MAIARRRGIALYVEVQDQIEALIADAGLAPGQALPAETELCRRFGVSRATVRQALAELERRGIVERHQGRGTFVTLPAMERSLPDLTGFSEHLRARGIRASGYLVAYELVLAAQSGDSHHFPDRSPLVRVVRLRSASDVTVGLHTIHVPLEVAEAVGFREELLRSDPTVSFYELLGRAGVRIAWAEEHLRARLASPAEAGLLGAPVGAPIMGVLRLTRDDADRLIEVVRADYLGDRYDYVVQLERRTGVGAPGTPVPIGGRAHGEEDG